jgi:ABC-type sugar transport system ATPase subunit
MRGKLVLIGALELVEEVAVSVVALSAVSKTFENGVTAVSAVDLELGACELVAVVGPSGSGKTTLLRLVAGLAAPSGGTIRIGGADVTHWPPRKRDVAMVFQEPALYPYLSVFDNLAFGLRARRVRRSEVRERVRQAAASLKIEGLLDRRPETLSGGQKRRVALGRAVARRPAVFLFDEPLTGLDAPLRAAVLDDLVRLHHAIATPMIYVTHDQSEALAIGDRVVVMERGRIVQAGSPSEIYDRPASRFVAEFIGNPPMRLIRCAPVLAKYTSPLAVTGASSPATFALKEPVKLEPVSINGSDRALDIGLRPEHVALAPATELTPESDPGKGALDWLPGRFELARLEFLGHEAIATVSLGEQTVSARLPQRSGLKPGDRVAVGFDLARARWFDPVTGAAIET